MLLQLAGPQGRELASKRMRGAQARKNRIVGREEIKGALVERLGDLAMREVRPCAACWLGCSAAVSNSQPWPASSSLDVSVLCCSAVDKSDIVTAAASI